MKLFGVGLLVGGLVACGTPSGGKDGGTGGGAGGGAGGGSSNCNGAVKNPPNLVPNPGFECGLQGWSEQSGMLTAVPNARTGSQSGQLVAAGAVPAGKFAFTAPIVASTSGKTYCAQAYLKGTVADAQLSVLEDKNGSVVDYTFSTPVGSPTWVRTPPSTNLEVRAAVGSKLYVRLVMRTPLAGATLLVDDVDVWESSDGLCKETR